MCIGPGQHPTDQVSTHPAFFAANQPIAKTFSGEDRFATSSPINIGHDVWIGHGAVILDGVSIGNGAIIAAGSVVTKDVPAYGIMGGVPAKLIKSRFTEETCNQLEAMQWWDKSDEWLAKKVSFFKSPADLLDHE